jgi:hypothetical protein
VPKARGSRTSLLVAGVAVAAVVVAAGLPALRSFLPGRSPSTDSAYPTEGVPSGITVTTSESAAPTDPFAGTPAALYPKGAAGISMPAAAKVTGFSAAQVGAGLKEVRAAMVAGRLDPRMLVSHQSDKFVALLAPGERKQVQGWFRARTRDGVATWIDPAVRLDPAEQPRVSGRVTYESLKVQGIQTLRITTNYIWVYAFDGPRHPLAAEHDLINWEFPSTRNLRASDRGLWVRPVKSYGAWVDCTAARKGLLAPTRPEAAVVPSSSEDPNDYLRADHSLDLDDECHISPS